MPVLPLRNLFQLLSVTSALNPRPAVGWAIAVVRTQTKASVAAHVASVVRVFDLAERVCVDYRHSLNAVAGQSSKYRSETETF